MLRSTCRICIAVLRHLPSSFALQANEELQAELDKLSSEPSPKELMLRQRDDLTADIDKLEKLKANLQQHKGTLVKKIAQREADLAAKRQEMGLLEKVQCTGDGA